MTQSLKTGEEFASIFPEDPFSILLPGTVFTEDVDLGDDPNPVFDPTSVKSALHVDMSQGAQVIRTTVKTPVVPDPLDNCIADRVIPQFGMRL